MGLKNFPAHKEIRYQNTKYLNCCFVFLNVVAIAAIVTVVTVWTEEGYEVSEQIATAIKIRVYGEIETNYSDSEFEYYVTPEEREIYNGIYDPELYAVDMGNDEVFVVTNFVVEPNQKQGICADDPGLIESSICTRNSTDNVCSKDYSKRLVKHGKYTGKCVESRYKYDNGTPVYTCEVRTWCPVINRIKFPLKNNTALLRDVVNSTIMISSSVNFPEFKNTSWKHDTSQIHCAIGTKNCPNLDLGVIIRNANGNSDSVDEILTTGAILTVNIQWICQVDSPTCVPQYSYWGAKNPYPHNVTFKYIVDWNGSEERTLFKVYGVRVRVAVTGHAYRLSLVQTIVHILMYFGAFSALEAILAFIASFCYPHKDAGYEDEVQEPILKNCSAVITLTRLPCYVCSVVFVVVVIAGLLGVLAYELDLPINDYRSVTNIEIFVSVLAAIIALTIIVLVCCDCWWCCRCHCKSTPSVTDGSSLLKNDSPDLGEPINVE